MSAMTPARRSRDGLVEGAAGCGEIQGSGGGLLGEEGATEGEVIEGDGEEPPVAGCDPDRLGRATPGIGPLAPGQEKVDVAVPREGVEKREFRLPRGLHRLRLPKELSGALDVAGLMHGVALDGPSDQTLERIAAPVRVRDRVPPLLHSSSHLARGEEDLGEVRGTDCAVFPVARGLVGLEPRPHRPHRLRQPPDKAQRGPSLVQEPTPVRLGETRGYTLSRTHQVGRSSSQHAPAHAAPRRWRNARSSPGRGVYVRSPNRHTVAWSDADSLAFVHLGDVRDQGAVHAATDARADDAAGGDRALQDGGGGEAGEAAPPPPFRACHHVHRTLARATENCQTSSLTIGSADFRPTLLTMPTIHSTTFATNSPMPIFHLAQQL